MLDGGYAMYNLCANCISIEEKNASPDLVQWTKGKLRPVDFEFWSSGLKINLVHWALFETSKSPVDE